MNALGRFGQAVASALAAVWIISGLCGSACVAAVCVEDCDPCVSQCVCHHECHHGLLDAQTSHKLTSYRLSIADDADGGVLRTISEIVGLSLDLADGPREHTASDFTRFAEGVIEVNGLLLQPRRGTWVRQTVGVFDQEVVVSFASDTGGSSLSFLFERRGVLVEIEEVRPGIERVSR